MGNADTFRKQYGVSLEHLIHPRSRRNSISRIEFCPIMRVLCARSSFETILLSHLLFLVLRTCGSNNSSLGLLSLATFILASLLPARLYRSRPEKDQGELIGAILVPFAQILVSNCERKSWIVASFICSWTALAKGTLYSGRKRSISLGIAGFIGAFVGRATYSGTWMLLFGALSLGSFEILERNLSKSFTFGEQIIVGSMLSNVSMRFAGRTLKKLGISPKYVQVREKD